MEPDHQHLLEAIGEIAERAGALIMDHYRDMPVARLKADASPVTAADEEADRLIVEALQRLTPEIPIVSEEAAGDKPDISAGANPGGRFWLVDPLDGTKEFLSGNGEFTVNIALIVDGRPLMGVVNIPALDTTYAGRGPGTATVRRQAEPRRPIAVRKTPAGGAIVLASRSHGDSPALDAFLAKRPVLERRIAGSSLKFCLVAEGVADLYPRLGRTMEWDTAAGHAVLASAGGGVTTLDGADLRYGKPGFENPHFIAHGRNN
jgi:3'(2'), 5'-bisphosphate nucleotidase